MNILRTLYHELLCALLGHDIHTHSYYPLYSLAPPRSWSECHRCGRFRDP